MFPELSVAKAHIVFPCTKHSMPLTMRRSKKYFATVLRYKQVCFFQPPISSDSNGFAGTDPSKVKEIFIPISAGANIADQDDYESDEGVVTLPPLTFNSKTKDLATVGSQMWTWLKKAIGGSQSCL